MATTNLAPASLLFLGGARREHGFWKGVRRAAALVLLVLAVAAALSLIQKKVYPTSNLFFARESFQEDAGYVFIPRVARRAIVRGEVLLRHLAVFGVLAPEPLARIPEGSPVPWVTFHKATLADFGGAGLAALLLLLTAWALAAFGAFRARLYREPLFQSLLLGIAFLAALHYFYGDDLFLYSCSWVFLVLATLGWGLRGARETGPRWAWTVDGLLVLLAVLAAVNNLAFLRSLADLYGKAAGLP
jgi:hypothetical protein